MGKVNVTITINEETADWARIEAAKRRSSISRMLGEMLESQYRQDNAYAQAMQDFFSREPLPITGGEPLPSREERYDR
ncbi:MAG: hypothetical protein ACYCZC_07845 [Acidithiobacillus sp.]